MSINFDHQQMRRMHAGWLARIEDEVIAALHARFSNPDEPGAARFQAVTPAELAGYVHHIIELGVRHDFRLHDDLLALVNACIDLGAKRFLSIPVLSQSAAAREGRGDARALRDWPGPGRTRRAGRMSARRRAAEPAPSERKIPE